METLACVIPAGDLGIALDELKTEVISLTTNDPKGIELQVDQQTRMRLEIDMRLTPDSRGQWLKVSQSTYAIVPEGKGTPFFRYDYVSQATSVPQAHINIHAHRDDLIVALLANGKSPRAKNRRRAFIERGDLPRVSSFHFPVGGPRFRPSLEDILEVAIEEFGLDHSTKYRDALAAGRRKFRERQLTASIRDSTDIATKTLESLGFTVTPPDNSESQRSDWLNCV